MLHRYEHGLILFCDSDPIWSYLRRTGRALFSRRTPGLLLRVAVRHILQGFRAAELEGHTSLRGFAYARCPHRAVHAVSFAK